MKSNYYNFNRFKSEYLLTNDMGFYCFLGDDDFKSLIAEDYDSIPSDVKEELCQKYFIYSEDENVFIEKVKEHYRNIKRYLFEATCLHIFVMTNSCNMNCIYCQAQDSSQLDKGLMSKETAEKAVEIALSSPNRFLNFEFQGGEPLINFEGIKYIVEYSEARKNDKTISYSIVTNTLLLKDEIIDFIKKYNINVSTSLDGDTLVHNCNRPKIDKSGTYDIVSKNIKKLQCQGIGVGAIQTTTRNSLSYAKEIVNAYVDNNLNYLFVRPLTPLGFAKEHWDEIGYSAEEFLNFYSEVLEEILQLNYQGYHIVEGHASIFLRKILSQESDNYMELRSPCGAGVGQLAYYYDGQVYTCDEGRMLSEMGLPDFCLGNVSTCEYDDLMDSSVCKVTCQSSVLESIPQCCDCIYHPYCGVCPVINYALEQNIYSRQANNYRCQIYKGILDIIFDKLYQDEKATEVFKTWVK